MSFLYQKLPVFVDFILYICSTYVQDFIGDEPEQYIWTDTRKSIFEE